MVEKIKDILRKYQERIPIIVMAEILSVMDEEEVCEWKQCGISEPPRYFEAHDLMAYELDICLWNYCPICGKKIKVVE